MWISQCRHEKLPILCKKRTIDHLAGQMGQNDLQNPPNCDNFSPDFIPVGYREVGANEYIHTSRFEINEHFIHMPHDDRPFVKVSIHDIPLIGLLDSGANRSVLGVGAAYLINTCKLQIHPTDIDVATASGQTLTVRAM